MRNLIKNMTFDEERALYNLTNTDVEKVSFAGSNDGESVLKETRNCLIRDSFFSLRYPLWHAENFQMLKCVMDEKTRAPLWYSHHGIINDSIINGIKAVRECTDIQINNSIINSSEFGWKSSDLVINDSQITSEYLFFEAKNVKINNLKMNGKYSFQYINNLHIMNSYLDTKDAFWHTSNVTVENSYVKGEYLGWFATNLTLINCEIEGTQPFCYCENLKLINCTMNKTDLAFEYSSVDAIINGHVDSIKNPKSGKIICDSVGEVIRDHTVVPCNGEVIIKNK